MSTYFDSGGGGGCSWEFVLIIKSALGWWILNNTYLMDRARQYVTLRSMYGMSFL